MIFFIRVKTLLNKKLKALQTAVEQIVYQCRKEYTVAGFVVQCKIC